MADLEGIVDRLLADAGVGGWEPEQEEGRNHVWARLEHGMSEEEFIDWFKDGVYALFEGARSVNKTVEWASIVADIQEGHLVVSARCHDIVEQ